MTYQDFVKSVASKAYESGMFELVDALTTVVFDERRPKVCRDFDVR